MIKLQGKELVVPLGLLLVIGCMIIPLPGAVLDILLCSNLLFALLLVIGALHIRDPLKMATLPSLLLMATLWRLSLNLATTRAVLSSGHAGQAVEAFGSIVIQGSIVVGFVLFLLISLIQFIVVAKGAERVAEVSARFTLDALPGKQMAIDAEVRSGGLDPEAARKKRQDVQMESRFYGALDGAMKFVKGDAIAGLVIAGVNILGGLAVGILVQQLDIEVALRRYTVLTIGDGLLSQIPSLLNSVAAGLVVTRVQVDESSTLASDLLGQMGQFKMARLFVAVAAFTLGCLPGMPHVVLLAVSLLLVISLLLPQQQPQQSEGVANSLLFEPTLAQSILIEINPAWVASLPDLSEVSKVTELLRQYSFTRWGLVLQRPGIGLWNDAEGAYRILIRGMEVYRSEQEISPVLWDELQAETKRTIDLYKVELIDDGATRRALDYVEKEIPDLVNGVVPNVASLTQMTALLRALLREGITTKHLDVILQTIAEHGSKMTERQLLAEVRTALAPVVSASVSQGKVIKGAVLEPIIDLVLGKAEESGSLVSGDLVDLICEQVEQLMDRGIALVASKRSRAYLRDVVRVRWAGFPVIAHEEIAPRFEFQSVTEIQLRSDEQRQALVQGIL